jgi:uncharacterized protein involved in exopolysaccharide biosynthesis
MIEQNLCTRPSEITPEEDTLIETSNTVRSFNLIEVLVQLARRKKLIAIVTGAAILVGLLNGFLSPVMFTATAKISTPEQRSSTAELINQFTTSGASSLAALAGGGDLGMTDPNLYYIGLLTSWPVEDAIIHKFSLDKVYNTRTMTDARKALEGNTSVVSEKSLFINVSVTDTDKKRAAGIANAFIEELRNRMKTLSSAEASQRRFFYEDRMKQAKEELLAAEIAFQQVQQKKGVVQPDAQARAMIESVTELRAQVAAKEVEVQALRSFSTEKNPEVQLAERELSSLQSEAAQLKQKSHSSGFSDLGLEDVPEAGAEYLKAEHELAYEQTLYDMLMKQYDAARLDEAKDAAVIEVVEPAFEPDHRSSPRRTRILVVYTFMGFFAACLLSLLLWRIELMQSDPDLARQLQPLKNAVIGRWINRFHAS